MALTRAAAKTFLAEYVTLPFFPTKSRISLANMGVYNYNPIPRKIGGTINYADLHLLDKVNYPLFEQYLSESYVAPVVLVDSLYNRYRTHPKDWDILACIQDAILHKQGLFLRKVLPIHLECEDNWLKELIQKVGEDVVDEIHAYKWNQQPFTM